MKPRRPRIGPCRDPLHLWFLEWEDPRGVVFRDYFADRAEARIALRDWKAVADLEVEGDRLTEADILKIEAALGHPLSGFARRQLSRYRVM